MRRVNPFDTVSDADICMAISNANGHQPSLFVPETSFHQLVKRQIWRLERPALETVEAVNLEMIVSDWSTEEEAFSVFFYSATFPAHFL